MGDNTTIVSLLLFPFVVSYFPGKTEHTLFQLSLIIIGSDSVVYFYPLRLRQFSVHSSTEPYTERTPATNYFIILQSLIREKERLKNRENYLNSTSVTLHLIL